MLVSFNELDAVPPHPEKLGLAIKLIATSAAMLSLLAVLLAWYSATKHDERANSGCKLVSFPNSGVPYKAGYQCADGTIYYAENNSGR